jgi:hypothetical protein
MVDVAKNHTHRVMLSARSLQFTLKHSDNLSAIHQSSKAIVGCSVAHGFPRGNQLLLKIENALADQQARLQFQLVKRLDQIIVGPGLHGVKHVLAALVAGEQNDVNVGTGRSGAPDALAYFGAIKIGQHPVEQDEFGSLGIVPGFRQASEPLDARLTPNPQLRK